MRAIEFFEARRNPEQNPRQLSGHKGAVDFLINSDLDINEIGVSMTSINKIGVNPRSKYNTPNGVYFYPAAYYLEKKYQNVPRKLPFVDDAPYIQIFEYPEPILFLQDYTNSYYRHDLEKIKTALDSIPGLLEKFKNKFRSNIFKSSIFNADTEDFTAFIEYLDELKLDEAKVSSPGGYIWFVTWKLSRWLEDVLGSKASNIWNWILRTVLGYNTVLDFGNGIIYPDEPTQGVVLDTSEIRLIKSIENSTPVSKIRKALRYDSIQTVLDRYKNKQISIHDLRNYFIDRSKDAGVGVTYLLTYLIGIEPNWKLGKKLIIDGLNSGQYNLIKFASDFIDYFKKSQTRWPEIEPIILENLNNPQLPKKLVYTYAKFCLKQRWPAAEGEILKALKTIPTLTYSTSVRNYAVAMRYVIDFGIKLSSAEEQILKKAGQDMDFLTVAVDYARDVLKLPNPKNWINTPTPETQ